MSVNEYDGPYEIVKGSGGEYTNVIPEIVKQHCDPDPLRRLCEMILVREYDDWYFGDPKANISKAIHRYVQSLHSKKRPLSEVRRAAAVLAWLYVRKDYDSNDAFLLLGEVLRDLSDRDNGRIIPTHFVGSMREMFSRWSEDRGEPPSLEGLNEKERKAWDEIKRWEHQPASSWDDVVQNLEAAKDQVVSSIPDAIQKPILDALQGGMQFLQDGAGWLVREEAVLDDVRKKGHQVETLDDLKNVPLAVLDEIAGASVTGGKILAGLEGAGAGVGGIAFVAVDIPALMTVNLRYIAQVAYTYGFDIQSPEEQSFMLNLLGYSSASQQGKAVFLRNLNQIAINVARRQTWAELNKNVVVQLIRKIAEQIGVRLTKQKLAQLIPVLGAAVGGGANYKFTHDNLTSAMMMYRKRYLIEKCYRHLDQQ